MRRNAFRVALVGVAVLVLLLVVVPGMIGHKLVVKAYFTNADGLRAGAPVRLAGVDIGSVKSVRARPELKVAPVEVVMVLSPHYELKIPNDSTVVLETAGVLGETYVEMDATSASGPPIAAGAVLRAQPTVQMTAQQIIEKFGEILREKNSEIDEILRKKNCDCDAKKGDASGATPAKKSPSTN